MSKEMKFVSAEEAIKITDSIIKVDELITQIKAYLWDNVYIGESYNILLDDDEVVQIVTWSMEYDVQLDEGIKKLLQRLAYYLMSRITPSPSLGRKEVEILWEFLENVKEEIVKC
jgi:hypothetical protein